MQQINSVAFLFFVTLLINSIFSGNNKASNTFNAKIEKSHSNNTVRMRFPLAGRPLSNPNTKIYIGARWIRLVMDV